MANRTLLRGAIAVAALGMTLLAPAAASGATAYETLNEVWTNNQDGHAYFEPDGEHLYACDHSFDGDTIVAHAMANGKEVGKVEDTGGSGGACGHKNLSIAEGTPMKIKVCHKEDGYCTGWKEIQDA